MSDIVVANYIITLPPNAVYTRPGVTSTSISGALMRLTLSQLQAEIASEVNIAAGLGTYAIAVTQMSLPKIVVHSVTTTTSIEDDNETTSVTTTSSLRQRPGITGVAGRRTRPHVFWRIVAMFLVVFYVLDVTCLTPSP